jgi:hypothetical protein
VILLKITANRLTSSQSFVAEDIADEVELERLSYIPSVFDVDKHCLMLARCSCCSGRVVLDDLDFEQAVLEEPGF